MKLTTYSPSNAEITNLKEYVHIYTNYNAVCRRIRKLFKVEGK